MIGRHDKEADARANERYFRKPRSKEKLGLDYDDPDMGLTAFTADPYEPKVLFQASLEDARPKLVIHADVMDDPGISEFEMKMRCVYDDAMNLCLRKHKDYGPKNISLSPGGPLNGLRVRMWDKVARANNLIDSGATPENESLRDTYVDILNYAAIAIMVLNGDWPSE